jgi:hypothetical protein
VAVGVCGTVIVGSVNANKRHWYKAGNLLARADQKWLSRLITRREKPEHFKWALERRPDDIKVVIQFSEVQEMRTSQTRLTGRACFPALEYEPSWQAQ